MRWMFKPFIGIIYWFLSDIGGQTENEVPPGDEFLRWDCKPTHKS